MFKFLVIFLRLFLKLVKAPTFLCSIMKQYIIENEIKLITNLNEIFLIKLNYFILEHHWN
jgi:hypothetical protein